MDGSNFPGWRFECEPETAAADRGVLDCVRLLAVTVLVGVLVSALVIVLAGPLSDMQALAAATPL